MASESIAHLGSRNNCEISTGKITIQWINHVYKLNALPDSDLSSELTGGGVPPIMAYTFFRLQVYERIGISLVEVYEIVGKSVISVCKKAQKGSQMHFMVVKV